MGAEVTDSLLMDDEARGRIRPYCTANGSNLGTQLEASAR